MEATVSSLRWNDVEPGDVLYEEDWVVVVLKVTFKGGTSVCLEVAHIDGLAAGVVELREWRDIMGPFLIAPWRLL